MTAGRRPRTPDLDPAAPAASLFRQVSTQHRQRVGYTRIVQLLVYLVIIPTVLLLLLGIILLSVGTVFHVLFGLLTVSFVLVAVTGIVLVLVFLRREANLSELQADFVSKVSHELRTPLTSIRLFAETMERSRADAATMDQCLEALVRETERLTLRIARLLDWGRMEAGRRLYELRPESVSAVVDDAVKAFEPIRHRHPEVEFVVEVGVDFAAHRGRPLGDARRAHQPALERREVRRHPAEGWSCGPRPRREASPSRSPTTGFGIPRTEHRRIFDKFYRVDDRLSRAREGSGLGLAIVKHVVRAHHGRIQLDSVPGRGSTFRFVVPVAKVARAPEVHAEVGRA